MDTSPAAAPQPLSRAISDRFQDFDAIQEALRNMNLASSNMLFAIDYSAANLTCGQESFEGKSLHALDARGEVLNPYEEALARLGRVLVEFDDDQSIQVFGFGHADAQAETDGVFSFTPEAPAAGCRGFHEISRRYRAVTPRVELGEAPVSLAPVIRHAVDIADKTGGFHMLVVLVSSQVGIEQQDETAQAIVDASASPMVTIVIGMGDGPWESMETLDDRLPRRQFDNFNFVDYQRVLHTATSESGKVLARGSRLGVDAAAPQCELEGVDLLFTLQVLMELPPQIAAMRQLGLLEL